MTRRDGSEVSEAAGGGGRVLPRGGLAVFCVLLGAGLALGYGLKTQRRAWVWDHWDVVKPGILYRSGRLTPEQMETAIKTYRIKTVVSFLVPTPRDAWEEKLVEGLGAKFVNLPMPGDGFGREDQFREALRLIDDPESRPVLVHCARGTCRTGAAVAFYRYQRDGWTIEDVSAEMRRQVYRQGWLPGYVFKMADKHPFYSMNGDLAPPVSPPEGAGGVGSEVDGAGNGKETVRDGD